MTSKTPIFIGGAGRAGTRLLRSIIGKLSSVYEIPRETYMFASSPKPDQEVWKELDSITDTKEKQKAYLLFILLSIFYKKEIAIKKFLFLKNDFSKIRETWDKFDFRSKVNHDQKIISLFQKIQPHLNTSDKFEIFDFVLDCLCEEHNCERWVEKTPSNIFNTKKIRELYPQAKFIAITRNPLAVYASWKKKDENKNIISVIRNWINIHKVIKDSLKNEVLRRNPPNKDIKDPLPEPRFFLGLGSKKRQSRIFQWILKSLENSDFILLIKYEDLINNPEATVKKICAYINEPFDTSLLDVEVLNTQAQTRGQKGFKQDSLDSWEEELNYLEKLIIKIFTKNLAREFGYKL
jgi:hypothetical protein